MFQALWTGLCCQQMAWLPALAHLLVLRKGRCGIHCDLGSLSPTWGFHRKAWMEEVVSDSILLGLSVAFLNLLEPSSLWFFYTGCHVLLLYSPETLSQ